MARRARLIIPLLIAAFLGACNGDGPTTPSVMAPTAQARKDDTPIPVDPATCRSGYNVAQGRCNDA